MPREIGSQTFDTNIIKTDEYIIMASSMRDNGMSVNDIYVTINAIDDMLQLQKVASFTRAFRRTKTGMIRKNASTLDYIENRIEVLITDLKIYNEP